MKRVREKKRWRKEEKWREEEEEEISLPSIVFCVRHYVHAQLSRRPGASLSVVPILPSQFFLERSIQLQTSPVQSALRLARGSTRQLPVGLLTGPPMS
jgi:hypothetical protein